MNQSLVTEQLDSRLQSEVTDTVGSFVSIQVRGTLNSMVSLGLSVTVVRHWFVSRIMARTVSLTLSVDDETMSSTESISLLDTLLGSCVSRDGWHCSLQRIILSFGHRYVAYFVRVFGYCHLYGTHFVGRIPSGTRNHFA